MECIYEKKERIRTPIIWFAVFMSLMLFQTSYMRLGTISAFTSLFFVIFTAFTSGNTSIRRFRLQFNSIILIIFLVITSIVTFSFGSLPSYFSRYMAQILLCIILMAISCLNQSEVDFLRKIFIIASVIYAILIIVSCYRLSGQRYYHASIVLFNTQLDPNFIGIPLVAASVLVLNNIFSKRKRFISILFYIILAIAIVYTASRGNALSFLISNALLVFVYMCQNKVALHVKIIWIIFISVAVLFLSDNLSALLPQQWERIFTFGQGADNGRFELWQRAFEAWKSSPIFGKGLGSMYRIYGKATHNTYFQLLSETGILGSLLFAIFLINTLRNTFRFDKTYFCLLLGCLFQITFLDALDNRCLWVILCWMSLLPKNREVINSCL